MTITINPHYTPDCAVTDARSKVVSYSLKNVRLSDAVAHGDTVLADSIRTYQRLQAEKLMAERRAEARQAGLEV